MAVCVLCLPCRHLLELLLVLLRLPGAVLLEGGLLGPAGLGALLHQVLVRLVVKEANEDAGHVVTTQAPHLAVGGQTPSNRSWSGQVSWGT